MSCSTSTRTRAISTAGFWRGEDAIPVPFSGVIELVAVLEALSPEPQPDDQ